LERLIFRVSKLVLILGALLWSAPSDSTSKTDSLHYGRLAAVASLSAVSFGASYLMVFNESWWGNEPVPFHFSNDFEYAKNIDKLGHFFSGVLLGEAFYDALRWTGVSEKSSYLLGGSLSSIAMIGVDVKDGYSSWGYSTFDVVAGVLGGFYPMFKRYVDRNGIVDYKFSYYINSQAYWDQGVDHGGVFVDDYCNQTHWLSLNVDRILPKKLAEYWPDWLSIAWGASVQEQIFWPGYGSDKASREYYVALDYDWVGALKPQSESGKRWVRYLNYIKLPAPAWRIWPNPQLYWVYPIKHF